MASFAILKNPAAQLGAIRVSASGPSPARSPLLSPRCHSPAPPAATHKHASTALTAAAYRTGTAELAASSRAAVSPDPDSTQRRSSGFDDYYDSAVPVSVLSGWERVEEDLGLDEAPGSDPQEWEEMVSLLSFDGEEHKKVTRQLHGANARVEDMFASFDGDDFEAVLRAARNELPNEPAPSDTSAQQPTQPPHSGSASSSLYESVCALRAAAMAAEASKKQQGPAVKKRRAPLGGPNPADAWMLQVPYSVANQPAPAAGAAAAAGSAAGASGEAERLSAEHVPERRERQQYSLQGSKQATGAELQLHHMVYIGMSCDSSTDSSCSSSQDGEILPARTVAAASEAGAQGAGRQHQASTSNNRAGTSNNIVSSRALGSRFSPASAAMAVAASRVTPGRNPAGAATATAVLEAAPAAAAEVAAAVAPALLSPRAAVHTATEEVARVSVQQNLAPVSERAAAAAAHVAGGGQQRWRNRSTNSLRRALARLHHAQAR